MHYIFPSNFGFVNFFFGGGGKVGGGALEKEMFLLCDVLWGLKKFKF